MFSAQSKIVIFSLVWLYTSRAFFFSPWYPRAKLAWGLKLSRAAWQFHKKIPGYEGCVCWVTGPPWPLLPENRESDKAHAAGGLWQVPPDKADKPWYLRLVIVRALKRPSGREPSQALRTPCHKNGERWNSYGVDKPPPVRVICWSKRSGAQGRIFCLITAQNFPVLRSTYF